MSLAGGIPAYYKRKFETQRKELNKRSRSRAFAAKARRRKAINLKKDQEHLTQSARRSQSYKRLIQKEDQEICRRARKAINLMKDQED